MTSVERPAIQELHPGKDGSKSSEETIFNAQEMLGSTSERLKMNRRIRIFIVRHGEQSDYSATDAHLTLNGQRQVDNFSSMLVNMFLEEDLNCPFPRVIKICTSDRERAIESGKRIEKSLKAEIEQGHLKNTRILKTRRKEILQTAEALNTLIQSGIESNKALGAWLFLSLEELKNMAVKSPQEIALEYFNMVDRFKRMSFRLDEGEEINYIFVTHETSLIPLIQLIYGQTKTVGHAEFLEIDINPQLQDQKKSDNIRYTFQGQQLLPVE